MINFIEIALQKKRDHEYNEAIKYLGHALNEDAFNPEIYYSLGKIYFLIDDRMASVKNYLIALHLSILENKINPNSEILLKEIPKTNMKKIDKINENAKFILINRNIVLHLAHSLNDLSYSNFPKKEIKEKYHNRLIGNELELNEEEKNIEDNFYFALGIDFAINTINFDLEKKSIITHYYSQNEHEYDNIYRTIFEKLR